MIYTCLKYLAALTIRFFYKKVHVVGLENVPKDGPLLIAMNHPAGFMEPIILAAVSPRPLHFLVRGDVFEMPLLRPLLLATHQIPIYRFRDGFAQMRNNLSQFDIITDLLKRNASILIYVEGSTEPVRRLRPLQKGMARIADAALKNNHQLPLSILPVGITFSNSTEAYSQVHLHIGKPLSLEDFKNPKNQKLNTSALTKATHDAMLPLLAHIPDVEQATIFEEVLDLQLLRKPPTYLPRLTRKDDSLPDQQALISTLSSYDTKRLQSIEDSLKILDSNLAKVKRNRMDLEQVQLKWWYIVVSIIVSVPSIVGLIIHLPTVLTGKWIAQSKVKDRIFFPGVWASITMVSTAIMYLVLSAIMIYVLGWRFWYAPAFLLSSGIFAHFQMHLYQQIRLLWRQKSIAKADFELADQIIK